MLSGRGVLSFFLWFRKITIGALRRRSRGDEKSVPQNAARKDRNKNENGKLICSESAVGRDINLLHDTKRIRSQREMRLLKHNMQYITFL